MGDFTCSLAISCAILALVYVTSKFLNWIWIRPKKLEKFLRQQGFHGNSYNLFHGDLAEMKAATREALSIPINFSNDIFPRVSPFYHKALQKYGMHFTFFSSKSISNACKEVVSCGLAPAPLVVVLTFFFKLINYYTFIINLVFFL